MKKNDPLTLLLGAVAFAGWLLPKSRKKQPPPQSPQSGGKASVDADSAEKLAGSNAEGPSEIPPKGWWYVAKRAAAGFSEDRVMTEAAGVTFYVLLALFPALASFISIYGLFADPGALTNQLHSLGGIVPGGGLDIIKAQVTALTSSGHQALGVGALVGLATSLWSANAGLKSLFGALNVVYHEKEKRSFVTFTLTAFAFTLGAIGFIIVALFAVIAIPVILNVVGLSSISEVLLLVLRWPLMLVVLAFVLSLIYRFGPSRNRARWQCRRLSRLLVLRGQFRQLQQDLRHAGGGDRLHDVDLDFHHGGVDGRRTECGARTADRPRFHRRAGKTGWHTRCLQGRCEDVIALAG
jgi:YihY family inner membrane protein